MQIFVSGATGVVGRRAIPLLLAEGHSVTAVARDPLARQRLIQVGARCVSLDLFDLDALKRALGEHEVLINLATHMPSSSWKMLFRRAWQLNDRIRREGVRNLVDAALACGVTRMVQESFALTYPDRGSQWIDERTPLEPAAYNKTVLDAELSVWRFASQGTAGVVLRFAAFYGPDAMQVNSYMDALRWGWAALPGGPHRFISSVSHDDAASAVVAALHAPSGAYNVVDDEPVQRADYFGSLASNLGLDQPRFMPEWVTPLFGSVGELMSRSLRLSNRKLKGETGWTPKFPSVRDGWPAMLAQMEDA
jgi:2-alkyl-3-oxoalkanoate reductase